MAVDRRAQCQAWNADRAHQVAAGQARARGFTHAHQSAAGMTAFQAFSARMRASHGSPQLFPLAAAKYVEPDEIGSFAGALPPALQAIIHAAWAAGNGWGVDHWLGDPGERLPLGSLFAQGDDGHVWRAWESGWVVCTTCWLAAFCPVCLPDWLDDRVLVRLPQVLCLAHGGRW